MRWGYSNGVDVMSVGHDGDAEVGRVTAGSVVAAGTDEEEEEIVGVADATALVEELGGLPNAAQLKPPVII